jgi:hypothetical protein
MDQIVPQLLGNVRLSRYLADRVIGLPKWELISNLEVDH